jgi:hypothetical protein
VLYDAGFESLFWGGATSFSSSSSLTSRLTICCHYLYISQIDPFSLLGCTKRGLRLALPPQRQSDFLPIKQVATMGIPYSKQINLAFDQVTPLVAKGFEILQTTRNITYLLAAIQVLTAIFLGLILISLLALIITVSPDLENERQALVTPVVKWLAGSVIHYGKWVQVGVWTVVIGMGLGAAGGWYVTKEIKDSVEVEVEEPEEETNGDGATGS